MNSKSKNVTFYTNNDEKIKTIDHNFKFNNIHAKKTFYVACIVIFMLGCRLQGMLPNITKELIPQVATVFNSACFSQSKKSFSNEQPLFLKSPGMDGIDDEDTDDYLDSVACAKFEANEINIEKYRKFCESIKMPLFDLFTSSVTLIGDDDRYSVYNIYLYGSCGKPDVKQIHILNKANKTLIKLPFPKEISCKVGYDINEKGTLFVCSQAIYHQVSSFIEQISPYIYVYSLCNGECKKINIGQYLRKLSSQERDIKTNIDYDNICELFPQEKIPWNFMFKDERFQETKLFFPPGDNNHVFCLVSYRNIFSFLLLIDLEKGDIKQCLACKGELPRKIFFDNPTKTGSFILHGREYAYLFEFDKTKSKCNYIKRASSYYFTKEELAILSKEKQ